MNKNKRVVIKLGSSILVESGKFNDTVIKNIVRQIKALKRNGWDVLLVCSGAVALGCSNGDNSKVSRQMYASIGQTRLISKLLQFFSDQGIDIGQFLFSKNDLLGYKNRLVVKNVLDKSLEFGLVTVINENDSVSLNCHEGNDFLAVEIADVVNSDHLVVLSEVSGLIGRNGLISCVTKVDETLDKLIWDKKSANGIGGMKAKLEAIKAATLKNKEVLLASGFENNVLTKILIEKEEIGTRFLARNIQ